LELVEFPLHREQPFLLVETALRAAIVAVGLIRDFIKRGVPNRTGLGNDTFCALPTTLTRLGRRARLRPSSGNPHIHPWCTTSAAAAVVDEQ
jgi:hypothetical protein